MKTTNIAVFGDLHGRILLAFWLAKKWQEEHNAEIDYIFSVGDVGIYRTINDMDKATKRFAAKYPEELGFSKFFYARDSNNAFRFQRNDIVDHVLEGLGCNFYFVEGNHEDHQFIGQIRYNYSCDLERSVVLDYDWQGVASGLYADDEFTGYRRIYALPQGPPVDLTSYDLDRAPIIVQAINGLDNYTHPDSWKFKKRQNIDILLSHETYKYRLKGFDLTGKRDNYGSERLRELIESSGPKWHFFGHHHYYYPKVDFETPWGNIVQSVGLNQLFFETKSSLITQGSMGIITVKDDEENHVLDFSIVDDPWYQNLHYGEVAHVL